MRPQPVTPYRLVRGSRRPQSRTTVWHDATVLLFQAGLVTVVFILFIAVWLKTENPGWRALLGTLMALSVIWLMISTFEAFTST